MLTLKDHSKTLSNAGDDADEMLSTIRMPMNLSQLSQVLPKSKYARVQSGVL
jgi:hypothetical protein